MSFWREAFGLTEPVKAPRRREYAGAKVGRLFADFLGNSSSADAELKVNLKLMRERCRDLARNDPYVKRYIDLRKNNVVGPDGFAHQVKAMTNDGRMDTGGNAIVESGWKVFCRKGNCTADGRLSFTDLCKGVDAAMVRDGEAFVQIVRSRKFAHGIAFHLFEADQVDEQKNEKLKNGNQIRMGVEVDEYQRPVAYWVKERHPGDTEYTSYRDREARRLPASDIIHVFEQVRPGQTRGEPPLAPVITQIKMLNGHREAELVASRMAAAKMGFFTSQSGEEFAGTDYEDGPGSVPIIDVEPGTFHQLPNNVDFKPFDVDHPSTAFADFQKGILRSIASAMGVSYAALSNDLSETSYSSVRQGALDERDSYRGMQTFLIDHFVRPANAAWLLHVMEFNHINMPAARFDKFYDATQFRGRGWQWVDPQKEVNAASTALHIGITSPQAVTNQFGGDFEEVQKDWQAAAEIAAAYGQELAFSPFGDKDEIAKEAENDTGE